MATNETEVSIKFKNSVTGKTKLEEYAETLTKIQSVATGIDTGTLQVVDKKAKSIKTKTTDLGKTISTAFNFSVIKNFVSGLKTAYTALSKQVDKSSEYLENINLFQVAFDGSYQSAEKWINKTSEMYGLDESTLTNMVGKFKQLSNAMNLSVETGTKLSTLVSQMAIDISSLYNIDIDRAVSVMQSSLAGQTKPIRSATGADITQSTLQTSLDTLGIDKAVNELTYAEKRLLIIISLTDQLSESMGDFGRTIESPANQTRILYEQWNRLGRAVGNVFLPIVAKVLPYLNAILMVLTEIIGMVAKLFGYNSEDYDYFGEIGDSVIDLDDGLSSATESAKKLKQSLRGFDKLNVITTPSASSGGSSSVSGGIGDIDTSILDAFNNAFDNYNSKLDSVSMKATKIRDAIMEWLGFTKEIDPITGDIYWKYEGTNKTIDGIVQATKKIWENGKQIVTDVFGQMAKDFKDGAWGDVIVLVLEGIGNALEFINKHQAAKDVIAKILEVLITIKGLKMLSHITGIDKFIKNTFTPTLENLYKKFEVVETNADGTKKTTNKLKDSMNNIKSKLQAASTAALALGTGMLTLYTSMKQVGDEGINVTNSLGGLAGALTSTLGASLSLGSSFGTWGYIIGGAIGLVGSLVSGIKGYIDGVKEAKNEAKAMESLERAHKNATASIEDFQASYKKAFDGLEEGLVNITKYTDEITTNKETLKEAKTELENYLITIKDTEIDSSSFDTINEHLDTIVESTKATGTASVDATKVIVDNLIEEGRISQETADSVIAAAKSKAEAQNDNAEAYRLAMLELQKQLETGKITQDEYNQKQEEAADKYGMSATAADNALSSLNSLVEYVNSEHIDYEDYDTLKNTISDIGTESSNSTETIKNNYQQQREVLQETADYWEDLVDKQKEEVEEAKKQYGTESNIYIEKKKTLDDYKQKYKDTQDTISQLRAQENDDIKESKEVAATALTAILTNLEDSGYDMHEDSKGIIKAVNKELSNLGVDIGTEKNVNSIIDIINDTLNTDIPKTVKTGNSNLSELGSLSVIDKIKVALGIKSVTDTIQETVNDNSPKIKFKGDLSGVTKDYNNWIKNNKSNLSTIGVNSNITFTYTGFAKGGLPPVGQLFVANEKGPELVGQIGGQSFVANQNQMMDLLDRKIGNAQNSNNSPQVFNIYLDENNKIGTYTLNQLQNMAKSNGKPIQIGG